MTSSSFRVDSEGYLTVADGDLDRDSPASAVLDFQAFAREFAGARRASAPVSVRVTLEDVNDNAPVLGAVGDVALPAGNRRRTIAKVED